MEVSTTVNDPDPEPETEEEFREAVGELLQRASECGTDVSGEYTVEGDQVPEWRIRISEIDTRSGDR